MYFFMLILVVNSNMLLTYSYLMWLCSKPCLESPIHVKGTTSLYILDEEKPHRKRGATVGSRAWDERSRRVICHDVPFPNRKSIRLQETESLDFQREETPGEVIKQLIPKLGTVAGNVLFGKNGTDQAEYDEFCRLVKPKYLESQNYLSEDSNYFSEKFVCEEQPENTPYFTAPRKQETPCFTAPTKTTCFTAPTKTPCFTAPTKTPCYTSPTKTPCCTAPRNECNTQTQVKKCSQRKRQPKQCKTCDDKPLKRPQNVKCIGKSTCPRDDTPKENCTCNRRKPPVKTGRQSALICLETKQKSVKSCLDSQCSCNSQQHDKTGNNFTPVCCSDKNQSSFSSKIWGLLKQAFRPAECTWKSGNCQTVPECAPNKRKPKPYKDNCKKVCMDKCSTTDPVNICPQPCNQVCTCKSPPPCKPNPPPICTCKPKPCPPKPCPPKCTRKPTCPSICSKKPTCPQDNKFASVISPAICGNKDTCPKPRCPPPCKRPCPPPCPAPCPPPCSTSCPSLCPAPCLDPCPIACPSPCPTPCPSKCKSLRDTLFKKKSCQQKSSCTDQHICLAWKVVDCKDFCFRPHEELVSNVEQPPDDDGLPCDYEATSIELPAINIEIADPNLCLPTYQFEIPSTRVQFNQPGQAVQVYSFLIPQGPSEASLNESSNRPQFASKTDCLNSVSAECNEQCCAIQPQEVNSCLPKHEFYKSCPPLHQFSTDCNEQNFGCEPTKSNKSCPPLHQFSTDCDMKSSCYEPQKSLSNFQVDENSQSFCCPKPTNCNSSFLPITFCFNDPTGEVTIPERNLGLSNEGEFIPSRTTNELMTKPTEQGLPVSDCDILQGSVMSLFDSPNLGIADALISEPSIHSEVPDPSALAAGKRLFEKFTVANQTQSQTQTEKRMDEFLEDIDDICAIPAFTLSKLGKQLPVSQPPYKQIGPVTVATTQNAQQYTFQVPTSTSQTQIQLTVQLMAPSSSLQPVTIVQSPTFSPIKAFAVEQV